MRRTRQVSGKILVGMEGLGVPDPDQWKQRAWELARINGRSEPSALDWEEASRELHGQGGGADSGLSEAERLEGLGYGEAAELAEGALGLSGAMREVERSTAEELVREGMEEAEHERMLQGQEAGQEPEAQPFEE
jgi:hypothetical protein